MATLTQEMKDMIATRQCFVGNPSLQESGESFEQAAAMSAIIGLPKPYAVVTIQITEIHSLKPGPGASKRIG